MTKKLGSQSRWGAYSTAFGSPGGSRWNCQYPCILLITNWKGKWGHICLVEDKCELDCKIVLVLPCWRQWVDWRALHSSWNSASAFKELIKKKKSASCSTCITKTLSMVEVIRIHRNRSNHPAAKQEHNKKQTENPCCRINWIGCKWFFCLYKALTGFFCDLSVLHVAVECYPKVD